jgi:tRNA dimethylallyltransferase
VDGPSIIVIAGPTASGKSALSLALAERHGGVVINADSMQVYGDLRIITARPSLVDEAQVPHKLYGHVDAAENYSVGQWLKDARAVLRETLAAGLVPIFAGGTGLYFKALTQGLSIVPPTPPDIRQAVRARAAAEGAAALHAELTHRDPATAARLKPGDRMRICRALEVLEATGRSLTDWHREGMPPLLDPDQALKIFLDVDRAELRRRIDARFDAMLEAGVLEEVRALASRRLDPMLPAMKAHGVPWLMRHLRGEISVAEAAEGGKNDTRRYTKRQFTWFRHQMPGWTWMTVKEAEAAVARVLPSRGE